MARRPSAVARLPSATDPAVSTERQGGGRVVEAGVEAGEPLVPHQHQEVALGRWRGAAGSKPDGAVLDGVGAVVREGLAGRRRRTRSSGSGERPFTG